MYKGVADELLDARIATERDVPVFTDRHGNEAEKSNADRFGRDQKLKINQANYLMFADKTECQTNMKKDGQIGKRTYLCKKVKVPQIFCCTNDHRFTVLPFTLASREAVCCVIIFQSNRYGEIPLNWRMGIDISMEPVLNKNKKPD